MQQIRAARRRRVPAFGEWNYSYGDEPWPAPAAAGAGVIGRCYDEVCSEAWFSYSPTTRKQPRKKAGYRPGSGGGGLARASVDGGSSRVATTPAAKGGRTVRCPVDADLYQVPPAPEQFVSDRSRSRKRVGRSMWKGCFLGLNNCVA